MACIFCDIASKRQPAYLVKETVGAVAFLDIYPVSKGHVLVAPKDHIETLYDLDKKHITHLFELTVDMAKLVKKTFNPMGINIVQSNERGAGQDFPHVHVHIWPRYAGDAIKFDTPRDKTLQTTESLSAVAKELMK